MIIITVFNNILQQIFIVVSLIIFSSPNELKSLEEKLFSLWFSHENCCSSCSLPVETFAVVFDFHSFSVRGKKICEQLSALYKKNVFSDFFLTILMKGMKCWEAITGSVIIKDYFTSLFFSLFFNLQGGKRKLFKH